MIAADSSGKELVQRFQDKGWEPVLMRAIDNVRNASNDGIEIKYDDDGGEDELTLSMKSPGKQPQHPMVGVIADFYNSLCFEGLSPKLSQLKAKLEGLGIPIYGAPEWLKQYKQEDQPPVPAKTADAEILEHLFQESKYELDEADAMQMVRDARSERLHHPNLCDLGAFFSKIGGGQNKDDLDEDQLELLRKMVEREQNEEEDQKEKQKDRESKMSKLFAGMFRKSAKNKESKKENDSKNEFEPSMSGNIRSLKGPQPAFGGQNLFVSRSPPNIVQQQQRLFLAKQDENGRKRLPTYDDFMNEAFNQKLGRGLNEVQKVYNEMAHHSGLVKPVGSMLQKWYVLANHDTTYWVSPSNKELSRFNEEHDDYYDMDDADKFHDCWLLYDMKRKRMVQEIRWRNRGMMNDPKYISIESSKSEETPWVNVQRAYLEQTEDEQVIEVNKRARYWRILFLGNHGEDTDEAPRFVFYEVQFWGKRHSTMRYSKASKQRHGSVSHTVSQSMPYPLSASVASPSSYSKWKIGYGDNARKGKRFGSMQMNGRSKFRNVPI